MPIATVKQLCTPSAVVTGDSLVEQVAQIEDFIAGRGHVRQRGGICGVAEMATDQAATVAIWVGTASISGGVSSAITSVCM